MKKVIIAISAIAMLMFGSVALTPTVDAQLNIQNPYLDQSNPGQSQNLSVPGAGANQTDSFVNVVRNAINWVLGILALIALILLLWGGFQMVTAAGDEGKYSAGFTILKQAAIGLVLIGVAWFVISIIFFVINITTTSAPGGAGTGG